MILTYCTVSIAPQLYDPVFYLLLLLVFLYLETEFSYELLYN